MLRLGIFESLKFVKHASYTIIMKKLLKKIPVPFVILLFVTGGVVAGVGAYTVYMSKVQSYLSDDPAACVNCHIMTPYYQSWQHGSHAQWTTCNDCHVPHENIAGKYAFKDCIMQRFLRSGPNRRSFVRAMPVTA